VLLYNGFDIQTLLAAGSGVQKNMDRCAVHQPEDLDERSQQVSFMKDIYDCAENVVVWLGEDS
jgi:hypothetical protein